MLLREFAVFYRRTLEDSADLILFAREIEQTLRYFSVRDSPLRRRPRGHGSAT